MSKQIYWNDELYHGTYRKRHYNYFTSDNNGNLKSVSYPEWKKQQSKPTRKRGSNSTLGSYDKGMSGYSTKDRRAYYHWYYENYRKKNRKIGPKQKGMKNTIGSEYAKERSKRPKEILNKNVKDVNIKKKTVSDIMSKVNTAIGFTTSIINSTMRGNPVFSITKKFSLAVGSLISATTKSNGSERRKTNHMTL